MLHKMDANNVSAIPGAAHQAQPELEHVAPMVEAVETAADDGPVSPKRQRLERAVPTHTWVDANTQSSVARVYGYTRVRGRAVACRISRRSA